MGVAEFTLTRCLERRLSIACAHMPLVLDTNMHFKEGSRETFMKPSAGESGKRCTVCGLIIAP